MFCDQPPKRPQSMYDWIPLAQLVDERQESLDPQEYPDFRFNYIGLEHVERTTGDLVGFEPKRGNEVRSKSKVFREGDLLYGRLRPYLNKVYLASGNVANGICSGEFYVLTPRTDKVQPLLLRSLLASRYVHPHVAALQTGSALPRLELEDLLEIEVPLPPRKDQVVYYSFLREQDVHRRKLVTELVGLPEDVLEALADAIEGGLSPNLERANYSHSPSLADPNPLPAGLFENRRAKSRPARPPLLKLLE